MENKDVKELIIQKKESYQQIIDETKKSNVDKTVMTGLALAAMVSGVCGVISPINGVSFVTSLISAGAGAYGFFLNIPSYVRNLVTRYKSKLAIRKLNKTLKTIDSLEEKPKTKKKTK